MADTTILSWISAEVDQALERVRGQIASYASTPQDTSVLGNCPEHLHQVSGALSMVGLSGATRFCEVLEKSFSGLSADAASKVSRIDAAVVQLKKYVDDLVHGQPNVALRLYPAYRDLVELSGRADASEVELFFPDLTPPAPSHPNPRAEDGAELKSFLQAQRTRWQRGILAWLRKDASGLDEMRETLDAVHSVAHRLPEKRAIWWVAVGLVDALLDASDPSHIAVARRVWTKIDLYLRELASGAAPDNEDLLRELLLAIARCAPLTQRIRDVKFLYGLDALVPGTPGAPATASADSLQPVMDEVREKLRKLRKFWRQYIAGEPKTRDVIRERSRTLQPKAKPLQSAHLDRLLDAIARAAEQLPDPHPRDSDDMLVEMAAAFLLADHILDTFGRPADDLEEQVGLLTGWLLDAANGKASDALPAGLRPELVQEIGEMKLRAQVAREILVNLQNIEQALDRFARGQAAAKDLQPLGAQLRQIHGALSVLRWERAVGVLERCQELVSSVSPGSSEIDWLAEGLSSLGLYLTPCLDGREPRESPLDLFIERFEKRERPAPAPAPKAQGPESDELLQIFLEEAREVLANLEATLPVSRAEPANQEALGTLRRGFHTLKGSGRMVGLTALGDAAWEVEQVMNRWLDEKQPATPELIDMATAAAKHFATWIEQLAAGERPPIDPGVIAGLAQRLKPEVGQIYLKEARSHIATLEAQCKSWCANRGTSAPDEFMRAAHTLASSSRTAGYEPVADLAAALEQWMPVAGHTVEEADAAIVSSVVGRLAEMVAAVADKKTPAPADELVGQLQALCARVQPAPKPKDKRILKDDFDSELLPIFLEEAHELVPQVAGDLRDWKTNPEDRKIADAVKRGLHTLKGSARMAGAIRLGELAHVMESRIEFALEAGELSAAVFDDLQGQMDRLSTDIDRMRQAPVAAPAPAAVPTPTAVTSEATQALAPAPAPVAAPAPQPAAMLRVNADRLDYLINESGEVAIARARIEAELRQVKQSLAELDESIARLRLQLKEVEIQADSQMQNRRSVLDEREQEFDPLEFDRYTRLQELTRMMAEGLNDAGSIQQALIKNLGETDAALLQQARIGRELQQDLMRMRALPFGNLSERLHRIVRQTARDTGKKAELEIDGAQVELDRSVLERIAAPLEHLIRNALAHGIEDPAARAAAGKAEAGRIAIALRQDANQIVIVIADDGRGINYQRLRQKAIEKGLVAADQALSEEEASQLLFLSGLSTAESVTELAGRGVGMDVVKTEISGIGGRIEVATSHGRGATFTIYLPLTLAVTQTVLVRAGAMNAAILASAVEQVLRVKADQLVAHYEKGSVSFQGHDYPLHYLRELLGHRGATDIQASNSVLLVRGANQRAAIHVDQLWGNREMVVKNIGPQLGRLPGVSGATVMPDGSIVLILNPVQLASRRHQILTRTTGMEVTSNVTAEAPIVMVVDDSITVRKITTRLLEREGYRVLTARDGVDALEQLKNQRPAVMLIDIEMPRMDGFDLTRNVRGDPKTMDIPIIVISSRSAPKHRSRAAELGVNVYLGKPYEESDLLQQIATFVRR
ncbi:MAG TPA: Hpt domain-containing protein [Burkholderiales bacterium]|nr:Hpt domain-containing protein [Burkholderiales bacterium]